jgi:hypothetical protein
MASKEETIPAALRNAQKTLVFETAAVALSRKIMTTVFISGSRDIKNLDAHTEKRINNILKSNLAIILGDADGVDLSVQKFLFEQRATGITVYCSGTQPRNNIGAWRVKRVDPGGEPGTRAFFTAKDLQMANDADYGLIIWDAKSAGTLSNIIELLTRKKKSVVYINGLSESLNIVKVEDLENLLNYMSDAAFIKANDKIDLKNKIQSLKYEQSSFFDERPTHSHLAAGSAAPWRKAKGKTG